MKRMLAGPTLAHLSAVMLAGVILGFPSRPNAQSPSTTGLWSAVMNWPMVAVHAHLLPTGNVLAWSDYTDNGGAQIWNPSTNTFTVDNFLLVNLFCAGHAFLSDGRLMITGGILNNVDDVGPRETTIFNPSTSAWSQAGFMAVGRYYPTTTTLPDGRLLVQGGTTTCSTCIGDIPEIYDPATDRWTQMASTARMAFRYYPHTYVIPDGRVIVAAQNDQAIPTQVLDLNTQRWTTIDSQYADGHSSAMYLPGKIMKAGKATADNPGQPAVATTYVLDATQPSPAWQATAPMQFPRSYLNLTILPDGQVLATGGGTTTDKANFSTAVYEAELWSPTTKAWTTLARSTVPRLYHSTALLLPDARVLVAGGGRTGCRPCVVPAPVDQQNAEIYSPPYLFKGPRPVISSAPAVVQYGDQFTVTTPDAARISTVSMIPLGSVTHSFNETQRYVPLSFSVGSNSLTVQGPQSGNIAPPGPYMLFLVDSTGVPSVAAMTSVPAAGAADPDLTLTKTHAGSFTLGQTDATYTLTVTNSGGTSTSGTVTVNDTVPSDLTATGIAGTGWACTQPAGPCTRNDALAAGASYPVITLTVTVATTAPSSVTNTATVSGGGETNTGNNTASDATAINPTGTPSTISLIQHTGKDAGTTTSSTLAFPANNTAGNWIAVVIRAGQRGQVFTVSDTRGNTYRQALQINQTVDTVTLGIYYAENIAGGPNTVTVADTVTGGTLRFAILEYSGVAAINSLDVTAVAEGTGTAATSGTVTTTAPGDLVLGVIVAANGSTLTAGTGFTIQDRVPTSSTKLATEDRRLATAGAVSATATLAPSDSWGAMVATFRAGVTGPPLPADLTISKTHAGTFAPGQVGATYSLTVTNQAGAGPTSGTVTVSDAVPTGLTATAIAGTGWTCTQPAGPCTRSDALAGGASYPAITLTVTVATSAPSSVTNTASVGGGGDTNTGNNTASDITTINVLPPADLTLTKAHTGSFTLGQTGATYTLTVGNSGGSSTSGTVTVNDTVPTGLTATAIAGTGWTCTQPAGPCTRNDALAAGASYPAITLTATVATSAPSSVTNTATVSGGGETNTANNVANDVTAINPTGTPSTISLIQHTSKDAGTTTSSTLAFPANNTAGNWIAVVIRAGKRGQVFTVTDTRGNTYRQAVQINQNVDVTTLGIYYAENIAGGPNTVTVADTVTGGTLRFAILEYSGLAAANSLDVTAVAEGTGTAVNSGPVTTTANGDLVLGFIVLSKGATVTAGTGFTIQDRLPTSGTKLATEDRRLATAGAVAATATLGSSDDWGVAVATFRAGLTGPPPPPDLTIAKTHVGTFAPGQVGATYTLTVTNLAGAGPTSGTVTVSDAVPTGLTATAIAGTGWTCTQPAGPCTRSDALAGGASYPAITLTVTVATSAPSSVTNTATVGGGGETNTANDTATDATAISTPDTEPPSAPGTLTANAPDGTHVDLAWGPATDNVSVTGYRVERCDGVCTTEGFVKIASPTGTSFSDSGLAPNTTYSYIVRAVDSASNLGPYSNAVTVTTGSTIPELIAAYAFDEAAGSTVTDLSGNGRTGTILNATRTTNAKYGMALQFNGTSAKVTIPDAPSLHLTSAMTLEAWVNPSTVSAAWRDLIYKGNDNYYLMATTNTGGGLPAAGGTFGGTNFNLAGSSLLPVNTWTHLAATYDGATLRLYVNGTQVSSAPRTGAFTVSANALEIGGDAFYGQYFSGAIDEVRIYNIALAPSQIQADMLTPLGAATPVVSFSRSSIDFGSVATGSSSATQSVVITNAGTASLTISSISITGANAADFGQTNTCTAPLAPSETCTVGATFTPTTTGPRNATLSVADNAPGTPHAVAVMGTGTGFAITPRVSVITPTLAQQFALTGSSTGTPAWAVDGIPGGDATVGTITATGLYTPPAVGGVHTVTYSDSTHLASATAYVTTYGGKFTHHNDNFRTGQNLGETVLTPQNVNSASFGKLFDYALDGLSMASPLYVAGVAIPGQGTHNVVYVATQHDTVYAFDADGRSSAPLWRVSFLGPGVTTVPSSDTGECCDIAPEIGITGTPVIDPSTNTLYVVAKTKEGSVYRQRLHALDLGTGAEKFGGPILIQASVPGTGAGAVNGMVPFDALHENQRPALLLSNGVVYIAFGSHGDVQPYHGWVLGYNATTLQQTMAVNLSPTAEAGGIWQANGGPAGDAAGNIYVVTGNGTFDTSNTNRKNYGDSIVKLSPAGAVVDFFTPHDQANINSNNFDLGAAGAMLLPDQPGTHPHLMVSGGKNNTVYLVDRDNMGKYNSANDNQIVQSLDNIFPFGTPEPGNYSAPVYFNGSIYFGPIRDNIQAFRLTNGLMPATASDRTTDVFNYPGATMAISANGSSNGILWAIQRNGDCGVQLTCGSAAPGVLKAYSATNLGLVLYSSDQIPTRDGFDFATKFSVPLVANGKVFVGSMGRLTVYGLLP